MRKLIVPLMLTFSTAAFADGKANYEGKGACVGCHGAGGAGDGVAGAALNPKPADFTSADFWSSRDDATVKKAIKEGGPAVGKSPMMPPAAALSDAEVDEILTYIKTFKK